MLAVEVGLAAFEWDWRCMQAAMQSRQTTEKPDVTTEPDETDAATQRMARLSMLRHQQHNRTQLTTV